MANTFSSYLKASVPQPANQFDSSPLVLPRKRSPSELYYSSYGESEGTPTPKTPKAEYPYSRPGFSSDPSSPTSYSAPPPAQVPRDFSMEDSGDESDDVYDQFDLGDFTKEEIKRYESMVGPGERLRDAASPKEPSSPAPETTDDIYEDLLGTSITKKLPEELHDMLEAGLSNAIYRMVADDLLPVQGFGYQEESETEINYVVDVFMEELAEPAPQMKRFLRHNQLRKDICCYKEPERLEDLRLEYGPRISVKIAQRIFEQEVYDFGRSIGLSKKQATGHIIKARESSSQYDIDLPELGDYDSSECEEILNYLNTYPEPEVLPIAEEPKGHIYVSEDETTEMERLPEPELLPSVGGPKGNMYVREDEMEQLLAESKSEVATQLKRYLQKLKDDGSRSEYDRIMLRLQFLGKEPFVENISGLREKIAEMEVADKTKEEKAARKDAKKARIAELRTQKEARRQAEKKKSQKSNEHQAGRPVEQEPLTGDPEHPPNVQSLEGQDKPLKQKKEGKKRKSELELPVLSEVPSENHHKHKKSRVDSVTQYDGSKKTKGNEARPQRSPFFQRSSGAKAKKKDSGKKAEQQMGFQPPMIQPPPADPPSTPVKKGGPSTIISPPSDDSSPLSSLRSTPSLLSFDNKEIRSDNKRIIQMSYNCARPKPIASTLKLRNDPTGLFTPASSPISLRDLNKRILEGSIYQDGIVLARPEAPATLSVPKKPRKRSVTVSPFFAKSPSKKPKASDKVSCIPFPPLHSASFGLVQERLSHDPFRLLIAVIFLNKTRGSVALPVFYELMDRYPTPADLAAADQEDVVEIIQHLGLQNQRAKKCINLAKAWLKRPPEKGKRYRVLHYPKKDDGKGLSPGDVIDEEDERVAWEIGQLPGIGVYAIDSWRIFCRDELRGLPTGLPKKLTPEAKEEELQKEWTRVLAGDKELRAYLRWRWLRNGWQWDPLTGERKKADEDELAKAGKGGVIYEGEAGDMVVGEAKGEEPDAVKAELEVGEEDNAKESGEIENLIADHKAGDAPEEEDEDAEAMTAGPPYSNDVVQEQKDGKATKDEPESGDKPELERSGSRQ